MGKSKIAGLGQGLVLAALLLCGSGPAVVAAKAADNAGASPDYLHWPLAAKYGAIDGKRIWRYVAEQAGIAERYRDNGHPQFWGRISGTSGDAEDAQWLRKKFAEAGLADTRIQTVNYLAPQWDARSWSVAVSGGGKTVALASAQPSYASPATGGKDLDLEIVTVGLGSEADFAGRDVRGKAILLVKSSLSRQIGPADILKRAEEIGRAHV